MTSSRFQEAKAHDAPLLGLALLTGAATGLLGGVFRWLLIQLADSRSTWVDREFGLGGWGWLVTVCGAAVLTIAAVFAVRRFAPEASGSGIHEIEGALDGTRRMRWWRVLPVKFLGGLAGLGAGLVLGREGPTVQMGGSIGQMLQRRVRGEPDSSNVLLAAGAGAGLTAAFSAPLSGVLFVIEEMRPQFKYGVLSVHALVLACVASAIVVQLVFGPGPTLPMPVFERPAIATLWMFACLGIVFGALGFVFNRLVVDSTRRFGRLDGWPRMAAVGGVGASVGALVWFLPLATGEGDAAVHAALGGGLAVGMLLLVFAARLATTVASYGTGTPGGIFSPMLALGTLLSMALGHLAQAAFPDLAPPPGVFALAGMAALFAASVRAPLTGIALTIEISWNYEVILPLMVTCLTATLVAHLLGGRPIYSELLELAIERDGPAESA